MSSNWHRLDDQRVSWLFLRIGNAKETSDSLQWWEIGIGNADQLFRTVAARIGCSVSTESGLLDSLLNLLNTLRRDEPLLLTPFRSHLHQLRKHLVMTQTDNISSLRQIQYLSLNEQLKRYFNQTLQDHGYDDQSNEGPYPPETEYGTLSASNSLDRLWNIWVKVFQLVPVKELEGQSL